MKKFTAPAVLFVLALVIIIYLKLDTSMGVSNFDAEAYLVARARIDSLEMALWESSQRPDLQIKIREELETSWNALTEMQTPSAPEGEEVDEGGLSNNAWIWIVGGVAAVGIIFFILVFVLGHGKKELTQKLAAITGRHRFKEPKNGFENDPTLVPPRPRPQRRSIIDDATEFAERQKRVAEVQLPSAPGEPAPSEQAAPASPSDAEPVSKVAFEDENGVPENKILTSDLERPHLRPTAKERITSAMQSLSDVLRTPRGMTREQTIKIRAQSHNITGGPQGGAPTPRTPLSTNRFDREFTEKAKILQMTRRGFPASAIASQLRIPQEHVEAVIKESQDTGA
ncbi:MAG: hypothetical protein J6W22_06620 [Fibrobacter sp.]|nr:hypothetical protein [Fibrobacter sp.]